MFGRGETTLGDRATGLLTHLLRGIAPPGSGVVIPSTTCHVVAYAVHLAGHEPVFCDVDLRDFNATASTIERAIDEFSGSVVACLAVHSFGHLLDLDSIAEVCNTKGVLLIEDVCQIFGSQAAGGKGDAVIGSFGYSKPVDVGSGGFVHIRNIELADAFNASRASLHSSPHGLPAEEIEFKRRYYALRESARHNRARRRDIAYLGRDYPNLLTRGTSPPNWEQVASLLHQLPAMVERREARARWLERRLPEGGIHLPKMLPGSSPWRYTFLVHNKRLTSPLTEVLREQVTHVSNWYPSLALDFGQTEVCAPNSSWIEERIVNLWVDDSVSDEYLELAATSMEVFLRER